MNDFTKLSRVFASALLGGLVLLLAKYIGVDPAAVPAALGLDQPVADASTVAVLSGLLNVVIGRVSKLPYMGWLSFALIFPTEPTYVKETK